jgi:hypothetical protein
MFLCYDVGGRWWRWQPANYWRWRGSFVSHQRWPTDTSGGGAEADRGATEGQNDDVAHGQGEDPHVDAEGQTHEV